MQYSVKLKYMIILIILVTHEYVFAQRKTKTRSIYVSIYETISARTTVQ